MKKTQTEIQVRFNDIDLAGHVHNSVYIHYFELGRIDFFRKIISKDWNWFKKGVVIGRNEIDYIRPIRFEEEVVIETYFEKIGGKSLTVGYSIYVDKFGEKTICAKGKSILVCFDFELNKSVKVYEEWKKNLLG